MILGSTPADAYETIFTSGVRPSSLALSADITTTAAPESFIPDALPAVTPLPSFLNAGFSFPNFSIVVPNLGCSSVSNTIGSPFFCGISIGTISSLNLPDLIAASALICESRAN